MRPKKNHWVTVAFTDGDPVVGICTKVQDSAPGRFCRVRFIKSNGENASPFTSGDLINHSQIIAIGNLVNIQIPKVAKSLKNFRLE